tara:strand:- start:6253 stop:6378 length:126 start_codon:yes stop_codon:yes gene_type:complete
MTFVLVAGDSGITSDFISERANQASSEMDERNKNQVITGIN